LLSGEAGWIVHSKSQKEIRTMLVPKPDIKPKVMIAVVFGICLTIVACSVDVRKGDRDEDKNVDIKTPVGDLHVGKDVDARETGLAVYPGARKKDKKEDGEENAANLNIATSLFGVKVVALEYVSDDPPGKVAEFYKDQLRKKFGKVLECRTAKHGAEFDDLDIGNDDDDKHSDKHSNELKCEESHGDNIELKVGTKDNQHIVAIEPKDKGTDFALVFVQTRGKQGSI
jgi:hypothetical protein